MAGAEVNAYLTAAALKRRGHTVAILHGELTGKAEDRWRELFAFRFPCSNGDRPEAVEAALTDFEPDVVYVHKMADLAVMRALVESGRPLVRMVHDHDIYCMRSYKYFPLSREICTRPASAYCVIPCGAPLLRNRNGRLPFRWVSYLDKRKEIRLNQRFHRMVVATDYMKQELLRNGFEADRIEIHAPVPALSAAILESSFSPRNLLIYAGQVIRGKGVDVLLRALKEVRAGFECVILGDGSHREHCQRLCSKLGLANRVSFKGYIAPDQLQDYYSEASVAVMSSVWPEPFGAVGLEAMRYGLPVVAFDAGGIREWLVDGETGFLVPHMNCRQFAVRVDQLLNDKSLARQMGARGRNLVLEKFNFDNYISGLEAMFSKVAAEQRSLAVA
jgi:glycosyltransferase involved in cell wall biosynthesis